MKPIRALLVALALVAAFAAGRVASAATATQSLTLTVNRAGLMWNVGTPTISVLVDFVDQNGVDRGMRTIQVDTTSGSATFNGTVVGTVPGAFLTSLSSMASAIDSALTTLAGAGKLGI